jgi:anti-sigma B factor antagonist
MLLRVDSTTDEDTALVTAHGEIDLSSVNLLREAVIKAIQAGVRKLTIDLAGVTYIDSSGLGMLVGAHKRMSSAGGTLTVHCSGQRIPRLLGLTGLDRVLTIQTQDRSEPQVEAAPA